MPTSFPLILSDSDFTTSARLRLGLPAGPAIAPALWCACGTTVLPGDSDHPLTCACLALKQTSRPAFVKTSWRRIAAWAGVHTPAKPPFRFFPALRSSPAIPSAGHALASSSGGCASGLPVLVPAPLRWPRRPLRRCQTIRPPLLALGLLPLPRPSWCPPFPRTWGPGGCHVRVPAPGRGG
jgi:hypothetical protein